MEWFPITFEIQGFPSVRLVANQGYDTDDIQFLIMTEAIKSTWK